ncbi:hypothetical protein [Paenibacillus faecis]|nr:hypothetical protein [Paenibacillus faecis]
MGLLARLSQAGAVYAWPASLGVARLCGTDWPSLVWPYGGVN